MIGWILSANVLILAVILMRFLFSKRIGRVLQYAVWLIVFVRLILPFSLFSSPISVENAVESLILKNTETVETVEVQSDSREYVFEEGITETINWYIENTEWINDIKSGKYKAFYEVKND